MKTNWYCWLGNHSIYTLTLFILTFECGDLAPFLCILPCVKVSDAAMGKMSLRLWCASGVVPEAFGSFSSAALAYCMNWHTSAALCWSWLVQCEQTKAVNWRASTAEIMHRLRVKRATVIQNCYSHLCFPFPPNCLLAASHHFSGKYYTYPTTFILKL